MNVACEHCSAEYSLDEENVSPRGVRITCPSCSHVFTVYPEAFEEDIELDIEFEVEEDGVELGLDIEVEEDQDGNASEAEELGGSLGVEATDTVENIEYELGDLPSETEEAVKALRPEALDFSAVGLKNWKVKTGFGLVYDFSDYKTLNKYLRDGKVKESDLLSYDGQNWIPMKDIDDLGDYFCSVYLKFLKHQSSEKKETPTGETSPKKGAKAEKVILPMGGMNDLAAAIAEAQAEVDGSQTAPRAKRSMSGMNSNVRASGASRRKPPARSTSTPQETKKSSPLGFIVGIALIVAGVVYFSAAPEEVQQPTDVVKPEVTKNTDSKADELRSEIQNKIKQSAQLAKEDTEPEAQEPAAEEQQLMVKVPDEILAKMKAEQASSTGQQVPVQAAPTLSFAEQGQKALQDRNWKKAADAYQKAYRQSPQPTYKEMWGYALFKSGNSAMAKPILQQAAKEGAPGANKWLGYMYRKDGDIAGSNKYFTAYLASNPTDAQQIQQEMRK